MCPWCLQLEPLNFRYSKLQYTANQGCKLELEFELELEKNSVIFAELNLEKINFLNSNLNSNKIVRVRVH